MFANSIGDYSRTSESFGSGFPGVKFYSSSLFLYSLINFFIKTYRSTTKIIMETILNSKMSMSFVVGPESLSIN